MDKRILMVALAAVLAACGGSADEQQITPDTVPAGATIEGVDSPAVAAPMVTDSAAMAPATDSMAAGAMTPPAMGTDSAARP